MTQITFSALSFCFPQDTMWISANDEIVGYSATTNLHIIIEDGTRLRNDWMVHVYEPVDANEHLSSWLPTEERPYPLKYPMEGNAFKLLVEHVNFDSLSDTIAFRNKIQELSKHTKD